MGNDYSNMSIISFKIQPKNFVEDLEVVQRVKNGSTPFADWYDLYNKSGIFLGVEIRYNFKGMWAKHVAMTNGIKIDPKVFL
jgi:hypothetical protein